MQTEDTKDMKTHLVLLGTALAFGINTGSLYSNDNNSEILRSTKSGLAITNSLSMNVDQARGVLGLHG